MSDINALKNGSLISQRYRVDGVIGSGGFGITYMVSDTVLQRRLAIKEYFPAGLAQRDRKTQTVVPFDNSEDSDFEKGKQRFIAEAKLLASLSKCKEIVHVHNFIEENNTAYILMDYIEGQTLSEYMNSFNNSVLPLDEAIKIMKSIISALKVIHEAGIIHRDISPDNIMIDEDGQIHLIDFGAARIQTANSSSETTIMINSDYAPVEQFRGEGKQDKRTDYYSLGAVIYKLVTGELPENALDRVNNDELKSADKVKSNVPKWFADILTKCMALESRNRYSSSNEIIEDINAAGARRKSKKSAIISLVALIVLGIVVGILMTELKPTVEKKIRDNYAEVLDFAYYEEDDALWCCVKVKNTSNKILLSAQFTDFKVDCDQKPDYSDSPDYKEVLSFSFYLLPGEVGYSTAGYSDYKGVRSVEYGELDYVNSVFCTKNDLVRSDYIPITARIENGKLIIENTNRYSFEWVDVSVVIKDSDGKIQYFDGWAFENVEANSTYSEPLSSFCDANEVISNIDNVVCTVHPSMECIDGNTY